MQGPDKRQIALDAVSGSQRDQPGEYHGQALIIASISKYGINLTVSCCAQKTKDMKVEELNVVREHKNACRKLKHRLELGLKRDKVQI